MHDGLSLGATEIGRDTLYVEMKRTVTVVRKAKNNSFQQKPKEIKGKVMKGVVGDAWKYLRDIQSRRAGLKPTKPKAVMVACSPVHQMATAF